MQRQTEMEDQGSGWNSGERTVIAKMEQYLKERDSMKLDIEELDLPLGVAGYLKSSTRKKRRST